MISKQEILRLSSLPILDVAARLKLDVDRHRHCHCAFHNDSNPSMVLYPDSNRFYCFACQARGGVIDLAMRVLNKGFLDTCTWLASDTELHSCGSCSKKEKNFDVSKYARYFEHPFINQLAGQFLFGQRKLHPSVIEWCRLTSWNNWLQIPYFDINGNLIGVQWRNLGRNAVGEPAEPRFKFPSGSQCHIYNLNILNYLRPGEELYIAEGCSDCWALMSSGHKAIAIPSATLLKPDDLRLLSTLHSQLSTEFHMYPDADEPGENLYNQLSKLLTVTRHQLPVGCKDYSAFYLKTLC